MNKPALLLPESARRVSRRPAGFCVLVGLSTQKSVSGPPSLLGFGGGRMPRRPSGALSDVTQRLGVSFRQRSLRLLLRQECGERGNGEARSGHGTDRVQTVGGGSRHLES